MSNSCPNQMASQDNQWPFDLKSILFHCHTGTKHCSCPFFLNTFYISHTDTLPDCSADHNGSMKQENMPTWLHDSWRHATKPPSPLTIPNVVFIYHLLNCDVRSRELAGNYKGRTWTELQEVATERQAWREVFQGLCPSGDWIERKRRNCDVHHPYVPCR